MAKAVADLLVEMLVDAGVKHVYAVTGDSLNPINDAIRRDGRIKWIHVRHEEAGAYAASMEAELTGIGCCMGSSGPGHVHLVNGLYDANKAGNPVIAIASTINSYKLGQDNFQETDPVKLFSDCSKYVYMANTAAQFSHVMQRAIQTAINEKGVAVVGLPGDVAASEAVDIHTSTKNFKPKSVYRPIDEELRALARLLNENEKITLYCGYGTKDAVREVKKLAAVLRAPIAYSFRGKICFDTDDNEYAVGMNGLLGHKSGYEAMKDAEVLVLLGTDFPYVEFLPQKNTIVQIDNKPARIGRRAKVDMGISGNISDTIEALLPYLEQKTNVEFLDAQRKNYQEVEKDMAYHVEKKGKEDHIQPEYVAYVIDRLAARDAIFTVDTGMSAVWAARFIKGGSGRYLTGSFNHGSMANAMPQAIGAALARPERQIIALCGDGGLSMLMGDVMTIVQYKLPVKIIVFNNRSLAMVKIEMEVSGYPFWQTDMLNPPFDKVAELMGIKGFEVSTPDKVSSTIEEALAHPGPALVNIFTDPNALAMPPHVDWDQIRGFMKSMISLITLGKPEEVFETVKSNFGHFRSLF